MADDTRASSDLSASVVVPTYNRPDVLRTCLQRLLQQSVQPEDILVVDASPDQRTYDVVTDLPPVRYLRNPFGRGSTSTSRAIGLHEVRSDVVAFVDDDAFTEPTWLAELLRHYADPCVGGVGGRLRNGVHGEEEATGEPVGALLPNGSLTGNFTVDTGRPIEVDHFIGANMSYRRAALLKVGGIHDHYPGTCLREETDPGLRLRRAGWTLVYTPDAVVDHVSGDYAKGRRFDARYTYYAQRNHIVLLHNTLGLGSPNARAYAPLAAREVRRHLDRSRAALRRITSDGMRVSMRGAAGGVAHAAAASAGIASGIAAALTQRDE